MNKRFQDFLKKVDYYKIQYDCKNGIFYIIFQPIRKIEKINISFIVTSNGIEFEN